MIESLDHRVVDIVFVQEVENGVTLVVRSDLAEHLNTMSAQGRGLARFFASVPAEEPGRSERLVGSFPAKGLEAVFLNADAFTNLRHAFDFEECIYIETAHNDHFFHRLQPLYLDFIFIFRRKIKNLI